MLNKLNNFVDKIGKQNVILIIFIIILIGITTLYQTFSLYTASEGMSIVDGIKTYKFILNASNDTNGVTIAANSSKNVAITVSNEEKMNLKYGIYYFSSDDLTDVDLGYLSNNTYLPNGIINANENRIINIKIYNDSNSNVTINFGVSYGFENGGDLNLPEGKSWLSEVFNRFLLNEAPAGSYVAYIGTGGTVGSTSVACQTNGSASSFIATTETEAPNSCSGQNAREDLEAYGYCYSSEYKYSVTGWRIAYIDSNNKPIIVSAGSPECNTRQESIANVTYIKTANTKALKYCNTDFVDGNCSCADSDGDGLCDSASTDAWGINDTDFYYITKTINGGVGKRLTEESSVLGDNGSSLGSTLYCFVQSSKQECGYNNDLLDNGGYYWFAAQYSLSSTSGVFWYPNYRLVDSYSYVYALGLRPVISLSSSVYVTGGSGTMDDPYIIAND